MALVGGVDSSTQSTKVEVRDLDTGEVVSRGAAPHAPVTPPRSEQDPSSWIDALDAAWAAAGAPDVAALSVAGQQHGMVAVDGDGVPVHPAKLWNDTESADDARALIGAFGGSKAWAQAVGSVPVVAFTVTKLAWLARTRPEAWGRVAAVMLPHDYITARLTESSRYVTDRGEASGTGYWSASSGEYRHDVLDLVDADRDWPSMLPEVLGPLEAAGVARRAGWSGATVGPGTGDNMAAAIGVGLGASDAVMSFGTSGTVYAVSDRPTADPGGDVAGFADATGRFLPLVCTSNASKVLEAVRSLLGVDHRTFDELALAATPGGPVLLPYFDGERTPNRPDARGVLADLRSDVTREQLARAAVDGVVCGLLDGLDALAGHTRVDGRIILVGGGARSVAVQRVVAGLVDLDVTVSDVPEAVATGAAVQAAAVLEQVGIGVIQQRWGLGRYDAGIDVVEGIDGGDIRDRYAAVRDR